MWKTIYKSLMLLYVLLLTSQLMAQTYTLKRLGVEDGLSNNYVVDITQDKQGCIWLATESGLNLFDGNTFTVYKKNNSDVSGNELNTLFFDETENTLWIGTQRDGISLFDCASRQFKYAEFHQRMMTKDVTQLSPASDGGIWITHYHVGVEHFDRKTKTFTTYADEDISNMKSQNWCSCDDGNGNLYIGHAFDGMSIVNLKERTARNFRHNPNDAKSLPGNEVRSIYIDRMKNIWVGTNEGLALFNPQNEEFITFRHDMENAASLISNHIFCIKEMNDGTLWVCADMGGVSILDLRNTTFVDPAAVQFRNIVVTNDNHGLSSANPRCLYQDTFGNIWIGNYRGGVDFISDMQPTFQTLPYAVERYGKQSDKQVWGICLDNEQQVWLGGENEIVSVTDNKVKNIISVPNNSSKQHTHANTIYRDMEGMLWLGMYNDGVLRLNPQNNKVERINFSMSEDVHVFYEDSGKKMWIGTETGVYSYTGSKTKMEEKINSQLPDKMVHSILRDCQNKLWIGTFGRGIWIFNETYQLVTKLEVADGFCSNAINHLHLDSQGGVWAATRNGLVHIKDTSLPEEYEHYGDKEGLEDSHVRAVQEDKCGNIWLSTNGGLSCWNKEKKMFTNYNHHDGVPMGDFMDGSVCMTIDGTIYFGSQNGVCFFKPELLSGERKVTPVRIIECKGFNRQTESREEEYFIPTINGKIALPYNRNSFRISFTVPDYAQSQQVEYSYMIEGLENAWYNTQGDNQVTFRNIPPGKYTFKVKARLRNQDWDDTHVATLAINVMPPLWLTWYAKLFYVISFCLALFGLLRFYKHRLELESSLELERKKGQNEQELNNERLRFYTNVTHELRTPLTLILGPLEDLLNDAALSPQYVNKISIIHDSATRLLNLINRILEFRKTETQNRKLSVAKGNLGQLVQEVGLRYKELNRNEKVAIRINLEVEDVCLYFDEDMIVTILNNLLSNAVKYTPEGEIILSLRSVSENGNLYMEIEVTDTGYGIDPKGLPYIFDRYYQVDGDHQVFGSGIGLALVRSLVKLHEGILNVNSTLGKGTTFTFRILTENTYPNALHKADKVSTDENVAEGLGNYEETGENNSCPVMLVVEDNEDIREYIRTSFLGKFKILAGANGKEGLELAINHIPDIIVSDVMMPLMDGFEMCRAIKEDIRTSHIPVILLTAKDSICDKEEGYESGADSYITKPFSAKLLNSRIHNLLEVRKKLARQIQSASEEVEVKGDETTETVRLSKLDNEFLERLTRIVEENIEMEKMDVAFIAEKMHMSHSTLYRKTKGLTDMSVNEFIRKIKIRYSARLLREEGYNVLEAAYMTGFYNRGYFRQCFKDEFGVTPSEYVKQMKEG